MLKEGQSDRNLGSLTKKVVGGDKRGGGGIAPDFFHCTPHGNQTLRVWRWTLQHHYYTLHTVNSCRLSPTLLIYRNKNLGHSSSFEFLCIDKMLQGSSTTFFIWVEMTCLTVKVVVSSKFFFFLQNFAFKSIRIGIRE